MTRIVVSEPNGAIGLDLLAKAGAVVDALASGRELSVADLATASGQPVSSTYRLVTSLLTLGWLEPGASRARYRLGPTVLRLAAASEDQTELLGLAHPILRDLAMTLGGSVDLVVRTEDLAVCVDKVSTTGVFGAFPRIGAFAPLSTTAAGRVLLAHLPPPERRRVGGDEAEADADRERGFVETADPFQPAVACLAAACFNHRGEAEAAIGISGFRRSLLGDGSTATEQLLAAAEAISVALGHGEGAVR